MKPVLPLFPAKSYVLFITVIIAGLSAGCGSSGPSNSSTSKLTGNTSVTVLLSSTANDQLSEFDIGFLGLTLTSQSGKTVTLLPTPAPGSGPGAEFMRMNGTAEPLITTTIPQDTYTSATATLNGALFVCVELYVPGEGQVDELVTATYQDMGLPASAVTVTLPAPITVTGTSMGLSLDLQVSQSASFSSCFTPNGFSTYSITPTFTLAPLTLSSQPTNAVNGLLTGIDGQITALGTDGNSFTLVLPDSQGTRSISVSSNASTAYQGISGFSALGVGTFVDMDGAIQPDGTVLATRIAVEDPAAADMVGGPIIEVANSVSILSMVAREQQGKDFACCYLIGGMEADYSAAIFQISGEMANLGSLPFVPSFGALNMVPGQNVYITVPSFSSSSPRLAAATITLMPQTIDGTVTASSQNGNFTVYTVSLAPYDLFSALAAQPGQTNVENDAGQVQVYVDSSTQLLNKQMLAAGDNFRFYGLVFNDNGTLRMDCAQVNDGVAFSAPAPASQQGHPLTVHVQQTRRTIPGGSQQIINVIKAQP